MFRRSSVFFATVAALSSVSACSNSTSTGSSSSSVAGGVQSIIFIQRMFNQTTNGVTTVDVAGGNGQVLDYDRYVPGGQLNLLTPPSADGKLQNITAAYPTADFNGADVSFDATQVVFSMKRDSNDTYHIYVATLPPDGSGTFDIHQKTEGMQDDVFPAFIAGGRIVFVTNEMYTAMGTRADEYEHARAATQLATISVDGGDADRRPFAQNLSHTVRPFPRSDGKIGYSRWEHLGGTNDVKIFAANPDGTNMIAVAGQHGKPCNSLYSIKETATPNVMIGIGTDRDRTIQAGALIQIDARNHNDAVCLDANSDQTGHACLDEENAKIVSLTPNVPLGSDPSPAGRYREPSVLPDGRILAAWADGPVNDQNEQTLTAPDFGVYIYDASTGQNQLVFNDRTKWDLNPQAVVVRPTPPVIADLQTSMDGAEPVRIGSIDITQTSLVETEDGAEFSGTQLSDALKQAVAVRVIEGFSSEAAKGVEKFGLTMHEGAAVLGTANVYGDGSWLANVPSYVPVHLQPLDKFGMSIRSQGFVDPGRAGRGPSLYRLPREPHRPGRSGSRRQPDRRRAARRAGLHRGDRRPRRVPLGQERQPVGRVHPADPQRELRVVSQPHDQRRHAADLLHGGVHQPAHRADDQQHDPVPVLRYHADHRLLRQGRDGLAGIVRLDLLPVGHGDGDGQGDRNGAADVGRAGERAAVEADREDQHQGGGRHLRLAARHLPAAPGGRRRHAQRRRPAVVGAGDGPRRTVLRAPEHRVRGEHG